MASVNAYGSKLGSLGFAILMCMAGPRSLVAAQPYYVDESAAVLLASGSAIQNWPDIDGNNVVWMEGQGSDSTLYALDLANPGQPARPIATGYIVGPNLDGNRVVYHSWEDSHVYMVDLSLPDPQPVRISTVASDNNTTPSISGDLVVWTRQENTELFPGAPFIIFNRGLYANDLSDSENGEYLLMDPPGDPAGLQASVHGDTLAYSISDSMIGESDNSRLMLQSLSDPGDPAAQVDISYATGHVRIDDAWIVYSRSVGSSLWQVYVADPSNPTTSARPLLVSPLDQHASDLSGNIALIRTFEYDYYSQILGFDLSDPTAEPFTVVGNGNVHTDFIKLSGNTFVYSQDGDIFLNHILPEPTSLMTMLAGAYVVCRRRDRPR